jgi:hypothetical protein
LPNVSDADIAFLIASAVSCIKSEDGLGKAPLGAKALAELSRRKDTLSFMVVFFLFNVEDCCIDFMRLSIVENNMKGCRQNVSSELSYNLLIRQSSVTPDTTPVIHSTTSRKNKKKIFGGASERFFFSGFTLFRV